MSEIINLPAGNYWFYGYVDNPRKPEEKIFMRFLKALENLGISDVHSFGYNTERRKNSGLFYFTYPGKGKSKSGQIHEIRWACSGDYKTHEIEREKIKLTHDRIFWENLLEGDTFQIASEFSLSPTNIKFKPGKTECSEDCIFYYACSGEKNSPLNPSSIAPGISCETHDFSKIHLEW